MNKITQDMQFRQSLLKYAERYGVIKAAIKYKVNRQYVYRWKRRYDGTWESLREKSHRPHYHPNQHTSAELKLISDMRRRNANAGLVVLWVKLRQRGYSRSITGLYRILVKQGEMAVKPPNPKYIAKPYEQMQYPGQRIQIDVKFVPAVCIANGEKYYQYTAIDEYSRYRYLEAFKEQAAGLYAQTMAERGFLTIAFDPSFTGESGGNVRYMASPDIITEDFMAAVDFLSLHEKVDPDRIGIIGICGWGGLALNTAALDTRVKATVASTMYDMTRVNANGYFDAEDSEEARYQKKAAMCAQRLADLKAGEYALGGGETDRPAGGGRCASRDPAQAKI